MPGRHNRCRRSPNQIGCAGGSAARCAMKTTAFMSNLIRRDVLLAAAFAVLTFARPAAGDAAAQTSSPAIVRQRLDCPLIDAIRFLLSSHDNLNFVLDPRIPGSTFGPGNRVPSPHVTFYSDKPPIQALLVLLETNNLVMVTNPATTVLRIAPANLGIKPVSTNQVGPDLDGVRDEVRVFGLPLNEAILTVAEGARLTVSFEPGLFSSGGDLDGTLFFCWHKLTCRQALAALLDNYDLTMVEETATSSARIVSKHNGAHQPAQEKGQ